MGKALLIVDMQEALIPVVWRGEELVDRIARLAMVARERDVPVVAIQQTGPPGTPFAPENPGWHLSSGLRIHDDDLRIRKTATDSFFATDLAALLTARSVDTVLLTGVSTEYCVDATARAALSHGFSVDLIADGHAPAAEGDRNAGLSPEQIIAHHNAILAQAIHPGGQLRVISASEAFNDMSDSTASDGAG
jgi:nicotinamidase-related amidase